MRRLNPLLVSLLGSQLMLAADVSPSETVSRIAGRLMCTCSCPHILNQCGDECGLAPQLVQEITQLITSGKTEQDVYHIFEQRYGARVYAAPKAEGFNLLAWVFPFVGLAIGVVIVVLAIRNLRPEPAAEGRPQEAVPEIGQKYRKLIEKELRER